MATRKRFYALGYARANRAGAMLLLITLCQYAVPALFMGLLRLCGIDTKAQAFGLPSAQYLLLYLAMYILMIGLPLWLCSRFLLPRQMKSPSPLMLSPDRRICVVFFGVALCLLANILAAFFSNLLYSVGVPAPSLPSLGDGSIATLLFDLLVFALVPAVMEELLLRGIVLQTLRPLGDSLAVTATALLFGLMHGNISQTPYAILMGLVLGTVYIYTDDLRLSVAVHALSNATAVITRFLIQYRDAATASLWQLVILIVVLMAGGVSSLWLWRHPLGRSRKVMSVPFKARRQALLGAPLFWAAILVMLLMMIVGTL